MQELISIILIGVSLSMDTFSLSLSMASLLKEHKYLKIFPFIVGLSHYLFPLFGNKIGLGIMSYFNVASNILLGLVLIILGCKLAIDYFKKADINIKLSLISIILLAFSVSFDSFTVGFGLSEVTNNYYLASFIFAVLSFFFTSVGILIGKYSSKLIGKFASMVGIFLLLLLGIIHLFAC